MKHKVITIILGEIYKDIDSLTYKYAEVSDVPSPKIRSGMQSDAAESLDGRLLARAVEYRDAKLRVLIGRYLECVNDDVSDNVLKSKSKLTYHLILDDEFQDAMLQPMCSLFNRYLTLGALYDWYAKGMGSKQAAVYAAELDDLELEITNNLQAVTIVKRPLQPWGRQLY